MDFTGAGYGVGHTEGHHAHPERRYHPGPATSASRPTAAPGATCARCSSWPKISAGELDSYIDAGRVLVAMSGPDVIGHVQLTSTGDPRQAEIKNMAVREDRQG